MDLLKILHAHIDTLTHEPHLVYLHESLWIGDLDLFLYLRLGRGRRHTGGTEIEGRLYFRGGFLCLRLGSRFLFLALAFQFNIYNCLKLSMYSFAF